MTEQIQAQWRNMIASFAEGDISHLPSCVQIYLQTTYRDTFGRLPRCKCQDAMRDAAIAVVSAWRKKERNDTEDRNG